MDQDLDLALRRPVLILLSEDRPKEDQSQNFDLKIKRMKFDLWIKILILLSEDRSKEDQSQYVDLWMKRSEVMSRYCVTDAAEFRRRLYSD